MNNGAQIQLAMPLTPMVKKLMIITVVIWLVGQTIIERFFGVPFTLYLSLIPYNVGQNYFVWQPLTYMFLHSDNIFHILFNMLMLWWLGADLEQRWGSKFFLSFYLASGIGAGIIYSLISWIYAILTGHPQALVIPVVGASGAIFGLMLAYGMLFGERVIYFMMLFPMKAKYFVMILGAIEVVALLKSGISGSEVANLAHLGGLASGFIFLFIWTKYKQKTWKKKAQKRGRNLRLVVDNDKKEGGNGPRYWN